jgi:nucleotidyltransferase AbiEii toxin of type IV toxin-antitoxin system
VAERQKHRHRSGYSREETEQVEAALLTVAVTLGALMDQICIVGGLVPALLIDHEVGPDPDDEAGHPGTNDLDVGLAIGLLDDEQYAEVGERLRQEGFGPDTNNKGNPTPQRWKLGTLKVTIDFLLPPIPGAEVGGRMQPLEGDLSAMITPGLQLAQRERQEVVVDGHTLKGEKVRRSIPVCGPGTFVVLKALAFHDRGEPKDAFDLVYVLRRWPRGIPDVAERIAAHSGTDHGIVSEALDKLASDFSSPESHGPLRAAEFDGEVGGDRDAAAADAHGYVDDLLQRCHGRGDRQPGIA